MGKHDTNGNNLQVYLVAGSNMSNSRPNKCHHPPPSQWLSNFGLQSANQITSLLMIIASDFGWYFLYEDFRIPWFSWVNYQLFVGWILTCLIERVWHFLVIIYTHCFFNCSFDVYVNHHIVLCCITISHSMIHMFCDWWNLHSHPFRIPSSCNIRYTPLKRARMYWAD